MLGAIEGLRAAGYFEAYKKALDPSWHDTMINAVAGVWIPLEVAKAHYRACDSLGLSPDTTVALGRATFERTAGTLLGTALRMAKEAGVTPWAVLPMFQRFWLRGNDGGGIRVMRHGPKEAQVDVVQTALLESPYYRGALRGLVTALVSLFCKKVYVSERPVPRPSTSIALRVQWV
jgi:hypothetical protein